MRVSLVRDGASGVVEYAERYIVTTMPVGVFDLAIGDGFPLFGVMEMLSGRNILIT